MPAPRFTAFEGTGSTRHRIILGALVLLVLIFGTAATAYLTRDHRPRTSAATSPTGTSAVPRTTPDTPSPAAGAQRGGREVLRTKDPRAFAKAAAVTLWSYDTRTTSHNEQIAWLHRWLTGETKYVDATSVDAQVPSPSLWRQLADTGQHATATAADARFPAAFTKVLQDDPSAITEAYVYAVTVTGKQKIAWESGGAGAEQRSTTLAVQCRPQRTCALVGVLPTTPTP